MVPRERVESAISANSARNRRRPSVSRQMSARSDRSSLSQGNKTRNIRSSGMKSRSISSLNAERQRKLDQQIMNENVRQLKRLQNTKASFDVTILDKMERQRQKLLHNIKH